MKPVVSPVRVAVNNNFMSEPFYILGHRGAAGEHPENTLQGFAHAMQVGVHMIELDIREHDSELWIFHDAKLDRLTNASGSFADCADPGQIELANGEPIPRLKVLLDMAWGRMPLNIEIKTIEQPGLLLKRLDGYAPPEPRADLPWILISSFNHRVLLELKELGCQWPLAPIDSGIPLDVGADIDRLAPTSWHFDNEYLDFDLVEDLRQRGIQSLVFTVNDIERARELRQHGVAGVFTDLPTKFMRID